MDQQSGREMMRRIVPSLQLPLFLDSQDGQVGQMGTRIRDDAFQQNLQMLRHPLHPAMLKDVSDVLNGDPKTLWGFGHRERNIEPGRTVINVDSVCSQT